jgi:cleavage and polyadenylation specificity factor subunit 1
MPFGLKNAGMTFQRLMDKIFFDLPFTFIYLDDLLVASRDKEEHISHLQEVLQRLQDNGLVLNTDKCVFGQREVEFLGHTVSAAGISPLPSRVEAIRSFPRPGTVKELQAFLGLFNFYRRFVPHAAAIVRPLTDALQGGLAGTAKVKWSAAMDSAFSKARTALADSALLAHPAAAAELSLVTDASSSHVGAVLQQRRRGQGWQPLGFFSHKLSATEQRYSAFDRELLAIHNSIVHFRHMLEGRPFTVFTDHQPLLGALARATEPKSDRQRRQLSFIAEFTADIRHIAGQANVVADTLSRPSPSGPLAGSTLAVAAAGLHLQAGTGATIGVSCCASGSSTSPSSSPSASPVPEPAASAPPVSQPPVSIQDIAEAQPGCPDCARAVNSAALKVIKVTLDDSHVLVDVSSGVMRPLVPAPFRRRIFNAVHELAHPGIRASRRLIASRYLWPNLAKDVAEWCRSCQHCQRAKVTKQPAAAVQPIPTPARRFSHVHVDIVGPLPTSQDGLSYLLTAVDRSTRWAEAFPLAATTAADCADAFVAGWVSRYGVPAMLTSDRGVQFSSAVWAAVMNKLGVSHKMTTAFHPQSNGVVERFHRRLKNALRARLAAADWPLHLPWVMLGLRAAPREDSGVSAAELVFGAPLTLPAPIVDAAEPPPAIFVRQLQASVPCVAPLPPPSPSSTSPSPALLKARFVYVRAPPANPALAPHYRGPYEVHRRADKFFIIKLGSRFDAVSVDRLKPHLGGDVQPAAPPRRGRPPGGQRHL